MKQPKINPQGIYAGLVPAIPGLAALRPTLSAKLKTAVIAARGPAAAIPPRLRTIRNPVKA
jgi:hypothetical protein